MHDKRIMRNSKRYCFEIFPPGLIYKGTEGYKSGYWLKFAFEKERSVR